MRILVSNDDGIHSRGLRDLVKALSAHHEVYVCAPMSEKSSYSHSVTYWRVVNKAKEEVVEGAKCAWSVEATPADCVYYGLNYFVKDGVDLVISGINKGENVSSDVIYSGTGGAAQEGLLMQVPAMALSLCSYTSQDYSPVTTYIDALIDMYMRDSDKLRYVCNVNVPSIAPSEVKGIQVTTRDGWKDYTKEVTGKKEEDGTIWLSCQNSFACIQDSTHTLDKDYEAVKQGYISVTPIGVDLVESTLLDRMKLLFKQD